MPRPPRAPRRAATPEDGFTLVELLVATTLSLCLVLPAYALLDGTFRNAALVNSRFARDAQARQVMTLLGDGSASFGTLRNARGFTMVEGIRSRATVPPNMAQSSNGQFVMTDAAAGLLPGVLTLAGDSVPPVTVKCTAPGVPLPSCNGPGPGPIPGPATSSVTTQGWMGAPPALTPPPPQGCTVVVGITVSDPFQAARRGQTAAGVTDTYRTLFGLNVEADPTGPGPSQAPAC
ncbi:MAG: PulJ/GspJ family protein [Janthinobacterium lividum]